jgi:hypothetical protein
MGALAIRRGFPAPSLPIFFALQALDMLTTLLGLQAGAHEASTFVGQLMHFGPLPALFIAKLLASVLILTALRFKRTRFIVFANYWFAAIVTWNLVMILAAMLPRG